MAILSTTRGHADNDGITTAQACEIQNWIDGWVHFATEQNHIRPSHVIDNDMIRTIHLCYTMNMSPEEAVFFCYRIKKESTLF